MRTTTPGLSAALSEPLPPRTIVGFAAAASWRYLGTALRHLQPATAALGLCLLGAAELAQATTRWWIAPLYVVVLALAAPGALAAALLAARRSQRSLLLFGVSDAGRACLVLRERHGPAGRYWLLENMYAVPARGHRRAQRAERPGSLLLHSAIALADEHQVPIELVAADRALAVKVYLPAGFGYADEAQRTRWRPRMTLPPTDR